MARATMPTSFPKYEPSHKSGGAIVRWRHGSRHFDAAGHPSFSLNNLSVGTHHISTVYYGDDVFRHAPDVQERVCRRK